MAGFRFLIESKWIKKSAKFEVVGSEMTKLFCWYQSSKKGYLDSYSFLDNLSVTCSENDSSDSDWCPGPKHEASNATDSDGISD